MRRTARVYATLFNFFNKSSAYAILMGNGVLRTPVALFYCIALGDIMENENDAQEMNQENDSREEDIVKDNDANTKDVIDTTEQRFANLESKMDRILAQMESIREAQGILVENGFVVNDVESGDEPDDTDYYKPIDSYSLLV